MLAGGVTGKWCLMSPQHRHNLHLPAAIPIADASPTPSFQRRIEVSSIPADQAQQQVAVATTQAAEQQHLHGQTDEHHDAWVRVNQQKEPSKQQVVASQVRQILDTQDGVLGALEAARQLQIAEKAWGGPLYPSEVRMELYGQCEQRLVNYVWEAATAEEVAGVFERYAAIPQQISREEQLLFMHRIRRRVCALLPTFTATQTAHIIANWDALRLFKKTDYHSLVRHFASHLGGATAHDCALVLHDIATTSRSLPSFPQLAHNIAGRLNQVNAMGYDINYTAVRPFINGPLGLLPDFGLPMLERLIADGSLNHAQQVNVLHVLALVQSHAYYEDAVIRLVGNILGGIREVGVTQAALFLWCCYRLGVDDVSVVHPALDELLAKFQTHVPRRRRRQQSAKVLGAALEVCAIYQRDGDVGVSDLAAARQLLDNLGHVLRVCSERATNYEGLVKGVWGAAKMGLGDHPTVPILLERIRKEPPRTVVVLEQLVDALVTLGVRDQEWAISLAEGYEYKLSRGIRDVLSVQDKRLVAMGLHKMGCHHKGVLRDICSYSQGGEQGAEALQ